MNAPLILRCGLDRCDIYPDFGGSIGRWSVGMQEMLRVGTPASLAAHDMLGMASFPLVPYSNRIGRGQFDWNGRAVVLRRNFAPESHAIHGVGWQRRWHVEATSATAATIVLDHRADEDWPWAFSAEQHIEVGGALLTLTLRATNRADEAVPLGFGHHPYFEQQGATLGFAADAVWMSGPDALPTFHEAPTGKFAFTPSGAVAGRDIDHCYAGVHGPAVIGWADRRYRLEITTTPQMPAAVVYLPEDGDAFCFEPVPHINNALNLPGAVPAIPVLEPGETTETIVTFRAFTQ